MLRPRRRPRDDLRARRARGSPSRSTVREEGLLFADIDLGMIALAKAAADPVGHYARADVTRLYLDSSPLPRVEELRPAMAAPVEEDVEVV